ncbi:MAG: caspase family protein [Verrucomicrobiaceae bacterium]
MPYLISMLLLLSSAVVVSSPAWAERSVALVIGNSTYQYANKLRNPANDAKAMAKLFSDLGFEVKLVLDTDRNDLMGVLGDFSQLATGSDVAIFYYAGHGLSLDNRNFLIPVDSDIQRAADVRLGAAVDAEVAIDQALSDAKVKLVFLDACRNNPFVEQIKRSIGSTRGTSVSSGLAEMKSGEGTLIAFSTAPGQTALDGSGALSPFAEAMLKELTEPGLEVRLAMTKVRADVEKMTMAQQTPWESTNLTGFFFFKPAVTEAPKAETAIPSSPDTQAELDLEYWKSVKDSDDPSLLNSYIDKFPAGVYLALAEARLRQLAEKATMAAVEGAKPATTEPAAPFVTAPATPSATKQSPPPGSAEDASLEPPAGEAGPAAQLQAEKPAARKPAKNVLSGTPGVTQAKKKPLAGITAPEKSVKAPKKPGAEKPPAAGSANDAAFLSKNIRWASGIWRIPAGASRIGAKGYQDSFVVVYKGRQYGCHSSGSNGGSMRASCSAR